MRFWKQSLMARLVSYFFFLSLTGVGLAGFIAYRGARNALTQAVYQRLSTAAILKEKELNRWIDDQKQAVRLIAQLPEARALASELLTRSPNGPEYQAAYQKLSQTLTAVQARQPSMKEIFVIAGKTGTIAISSDKESEGEYRSGEPYFKRGQTETFIKNVYPYPGKTHNQPAITIATPLRSPQNKPLGVLAIHLQLERMDLIVLEEDSFGELGESYLVDQFFQFVSAKRFGRDTVPARIHTVGIDAAIKSGQDGSGLYLNYEGVPVIGAYHWLDEREMALLLEIPQRDAFAPARTLAWEILSIGFIVVVILALGVYWIARQIARPILSITNSAKRLAEGHLNEQVPVVSHDEIGILERAFNQMAQKLQDSFETLESQNEHMKRLNADLQRIDKFKDEFLSNTSHELRTPLNGMIGIAESMLDGATGSVTAQQRLNLVMIAQSGHRLANLVNDILDFSKLKYKTIDLQFQAVDIRGVANLVIMLNRPLIGSKSVQLVNTIPANLPPALADENRLQQILHNLVGNAIKFTETGRIELSAHIVESPQPEPVTESSQEGISNPVTKPQIPERQLVIAVRDTGIGISMEKQQRIFQFFEQADDTIARNYGGTGLGLAVTKQLIELHRGEINVESTVGAGSCFTFTLPIAHSQVPTTVTLSVDEAITMPEVPGPLLRPRVMDPSRLSPEQIRILIVDDEPVNRQVLMNNLSLYDYALAQASNGPEALDRIENHFRPDLILLDVMMPGMTGYEVTQHLREKYSATELPIILLTAKTEVKDIVTGFNVGANDYLTKPISKDELLVRIKTQISLCRFRAENIRLGAELDIARQLQQLILPKSSEMQSIQDLDIASFMEPAKEVGGDYYDILTNGKGVKIGIGDVTGHGLESGVLMLMVQTAVRTLAENHQTDPIQFLDVINRTLYHNIQRMNWDKNMTLALLDYSDGMLRFSGQHEQMILVRSGGNVEEIDTLDLGFPLGLEPQIKQFIAQEHIQLERDDVVVLYTDGVTEAENIQGVQYGTQRLCQIVSQNWQLRAPDICQLVLKDLQGHIGEQKIFDDMTLIVLKQR